MISYTYEAKIWYIYRYAELNDEDLLGRKRHKRSGNSSFQSNMKSDNRIHLGSDAQKIHKERC